MSKKQILTIFLIIIFVFGAYFSFRSLKVFQQAEVKNQMKPITIDYWRVYDGPDVFAPIIEKYNAIHPYIKINYRKLLYSEYEQALLEGFATDRGPDVFSIHNTWIGKYKTKELISPLPPQITMAYPVLKGKIKKEIVPELRTVRSLNTRDIENKFVDVVYDDIIYREEDRKTKQVTYNIYGLPLSVDTLAMYYNKDLFNNAGISLPSEFWNRKFQQDVKKLTKQDARGNIIQSGAALGGSDNIERFSDILSVLMMQNGTVMIDSAGRVAYNAIPDVFKDKSYNPGLEAVRFYTDFANPGKEVFSWNGDLDNSIDLFADGKLAMLFAYSYHLPMIKAKNPKLNFNIAKLPQIEGNESPVNFANYWVEAVSSKSKNKDAAWNFVQFITEAEQAKMYFEKTKKPTALRTLVTEQVDDLDTGVFASQVLTAKSWYRGNNVTAAENYIKEVIDDVNAGRGEIIDILTMSARKVQQTLSE